MRYITPSTLPTPYALPPKTPHPNSLNPQQPEKQRPRQDKTRQTTPTKHLGRPHLARTPKIPRRFPARIQKHHQHANQTRPDQVKDEARVGLEAEDARGDAEDGARYGADVRDCLAVLEGLR